MAFFSLSFVFLLSVGVQAMISGGFDNSCTYLYMLNPRLEVNGQSFLSHYKSKNNWNNISIESKSSLIISGKAWFEWMLTPFQAGRGEKTNATVLEIRKTTDDANRSQRRTADDSG